MKRRLLSVVLLGFPVVSLIFLLSVLLYSSLGKVTDTSLNERGGRVTDLEKKAGEQALVSSYWLNAEEEYNSFREKYLIRLERFADFRLSLGDMIGRQHLQYTGLKYTNKNSQDGKVIFVRFSFDVEGAYEQIKRLIWDLERLPHVARIGKLTMMGKTDSRIQCGLELEVVFEK